MTGFTVSSLVDSDLTTRQKYPCGQTLSLTELDPVGQYHPASQSPTGAARPVELQYIPAVHGVISCEPSGQ